jgi:hypothetical protein
MDYAEVDEDRGREGEEDGPFVESDARGGFGGGLRVLVAHFGSFRLRSWECFFGHPGGANALRLHRGEEAGIKARGGFRLIELAKHFGKASGLKA